MAREALTIDEVAEIRWRYAQPGHPSQRDLARAYNVHPSTISRVVTGRAWPSASGPIFPHKPLREAAP